MITDDQARPQLEALGQALGGQPAPCMTRDAEVWFDDPQLAAALCVADCHALAECADLAAALRPQHGVWAGVDHDPKAAQRLRRNNTRPKEVTR